MRCTFAAAVGFSVVLMAGCATRDGTVRVGDVQAAAAGAGQEASSSAKGLADDAPADAAPNAAPSAAISALRDQARRERSAGQPVRAAATLERALRIDARAPELWRDLAELRLDGGDARQAEQFARKSAELGRTDAERRLAWRVVARALERQGRSEEAMNAWLRAGGR